MLESSIGSAGLNQAGGSDVSPEKESGDGVTGRPLSRGAWFPSETFHPLGRVAVTSARAGRPRASRLLCEPEKTMLPSRSRSPSTCHGTPWHFRCHPRVSECARAPPLHQRKLQSCTSFLWTPPIRTRESEVRQPSPLLSPANAACSTASMSPISAERCRRAHDVSSTRRSLSATRRQIAAGIWLFVTGPVRVPIDRLAGQLQTIC